MKKREKETRKCIPRGVSETAREDKMKEERNLYEVLQLAGGGGKAVQGLVLCNTIDPGAAGRRRHLQKVSSVGLAAGGMMHKKGGKEKGARRPAKEP